MQRPSTMRMTAEKLEEQWAPTKMQAAFVFDSRTFSSTSNGGIFVDLPFPNLGWTFALSLTPKWGSVINGRGHRDPQGHRYHQVPTKKLSGWVPTALSLNQDGSEIRWGRTSVDAQLSLAMEQRECTTALEECTPDNTTWSDSTVLVTMKGVLADGPWTEVPVTTPYALSLPQRTKVSLVVTISECPFTNGLFKAVSNQFSVLESETKARLVNRTGDHLLARSLTTGELFDVKFLARATHSASGKTGEVFETYASLAVLEEHVNFSSAKLGEEWRNTFVALDHCDNGDQKHVEQILCAGDDEYELDSDFEDEDEASAPVEPCTLSPPNEHGMTMPEGQQLDSDTDASGSLSPYDLGGASDRGSPTSLLEEVIKGPNEPHHSSSVAATDRKRTVLVSFAAHRTWYAFVWYCYTGRLNFSQLKSQAEPGVRRFPATRLRVGPPSCSPKSMYRLADLIGNDILKAKALEAIRERMSKANILEETFSAFTSKYPDVRAVQLSVLMKHFGSPEIKMSFPKAVLKLSGMPHAEPALAAFYDKLAGRVRLFCPSGGADCPSTCANSFQ